MERSKQLGEGKVSKLLLKFSLPAIVGMLVNALYNVVDRIFIGNWGGDEGIAGITVGFPIMLVTMAFAMLIGLGGTSLFSIKLGEQKREEAESILGNSLILMVIISATIAALGIIFMDPVLMITGASEKVLPYAREYLQIILLGTPFSCIGFGMNNFIRSEGNPMTAMATMFIGAILNVILDPIFIFVFGWGMRGAAIATVISQVVSAIWVMSYFLMGRSTTRFNISSLNLKIKTVTGIVSLGFAPFAMQLAASVVSGLMSGSLQRYGGDVAVAGMGVINSIVTLIIMPIFGINQGVQPIIGYNYGAKKYDRVKEAFKLAVMAATFISTLGFAGVMLFPAQLVALFGKDNIALIDFSAYALRIFLIFLPIIGFQIVTSVYFQATGKPVHSSILSLSRQVLFLIPAIIVLPIFFGLNGVLFAGPLADLMSSLLTVALILMEFKKLRERVETDEYAEGLNTDFPDLQT